MEQWREDLYAGMSYDNALAHHGIKGQKWGVRRYQNDDGTLTEAGRKRRAREFAKELNANDKQLGYLLGDGRRVSKKLSKQLERQSEGKKKVDYDKLEKNLAKRIAVMDEISSRQQHRDKLLEQASKEKYNVVVSRVPRDVRRPITEAKQFIKSLSTFGLSDILSSENNVYLGLEYKVKSS